MSVTGSATVESQAQTQAKAFSDGLFACGMELLEAYRVEQSGTLVNYEALGRKIAERSAGLVALAGALAALDAVRDSGPRRTNHTGDGEARR